MPIYLKESTASQEVPLGYFVDSTDGNTEETALTIANTDIKLWKTGATTLANKNSGGGTHISNGIYYAVLDATDTNTIGPMVIFCHVTGALAVRVETVVLPTKVYDSLIAGTDNLEIDIVQAGGSSISQSGGLLNANATQISGDAVAADNLEAACDGTTYNIGGGAVVAASVTGAVGSVTGNVGGNVTGSIGSLGTTAKADVNAEVLDVLNTDTFAEPGQEAPGATVSLVKKIGYLYKAWRNKSTQTATEYKLYADDTTTVDQKAATSDDGTTFTRGEQATGP